MITVSIILLMAAFYLTAGFLFAIVFVVKGVSKIDESAKDAAWGFRIIILPGAIVFWPFLLKKWVQSSKKTNDQ